MPRTIDDPGVHGSSPSRCRQADAFTVTASWGTYELSRRMKRRRRPPGSPLPTDAHRRATHDPLERRGSWGHSQPLSCCRDSVVLRVDRYDDPTYDQSRVEIALCNDRETDAHPPSMWMFQDSCAWMRAAEIFLPVRDLLEHEWPEDDEEVQRLNLRYRNRLEFAIGRTTRRLGCRASGYRGVDDLASVRDAAPERDLLRVRCCLWMPCRG